MDEENNNKISFSAFKKIIKNGARLSKMIWKDKRGMTVALVFVFLVISASPFLQSGSQGMLINELVKIAGKNVLDSRLYMIIIAVIIASILPSIFYKIQEYQSKLFYLFLNEKFEILAIKKKGEIDVAVHENPKFNDLLNKVSENGIYRAANFSERQFFIFQNFIEVLIASIIIFSFEWWVFLIVFLGTLPELIVEFVYGSDVWAIHGAKAEIRRRFWNLRGHFNVLPRIIELKTFQNAGYFLSSIRQLFTNFMDEQKKTEKKNFVNQFISLAFSQAAIAFAVFYFVLQVAHGDILIGTFTFIIASITDLRRALSSFFVNIGRQYQDGLFVNDFFDFLDIKPVVLKTEKEITLNSKKTPEIIFENVSFKYPGTDKFILKNLSLKIASGEKLALVGVNGAGKTTFVKLLCRFYDPTEGRILLNGQDLKEIDLESWYRVLGILFQDYANYQFVAHEAIAVGRTDENNNESTIAKVKKAARASEANVFIEEWEKSYNQMLGKEFSEGVEPSIGQWQKLALARTFYRDPKILILDEPTSSIDAESEAKIFEKLEHLPKDRTVILISHRFSTVRHAGKIAVIKNGELKELGNHDELLSKKGIYAKLFNLQAEGYK